MNPTLFAAVICLVPLLASAQVRKCVDAKGKTVYSDVVCADTSARETHISVNPNVISSPGDRDGAGSEANPYDRELRGKIAGYLARKNYDGAMALAVTEDHFQMIEKARASHRQEVAADRASRQANGPTVCATNGYAQRSGIYSGTTVCRTARGGSSSTEAAANAQQKAAQDIGKSRAEFYRDQMRRQ